MITRPLRSKVTDVGLFLAGLMGVSSTLFGGVQSLHRSLDTVVLQSGDRVVLKTRAGEVISLREDDNVSFPGDSIFETLSARQSTVVEGLVGPGSPMIGQSIASLKFRRRYGVYSLAVHRAGENVSRDLDSVILQVGDTILMEGSAEDLERLSTEQNLINLAEPRDRPFRRTKGSLRCRHHVGGYSIISSWFCSYHSFSIGRGCSGFY